MTAKTRKIGKGRNSFTVLESDYKDDFPKSEYMITYIKSGKECLCDAHMLRKEIARIESIVEIKKPKKVKYNDSKTDS